MDEEATQPSTQPYLDPRRTGRSGELGPEDGSDIVLTLHPTTPAAIDAVRSCAEFCPQHVFQPGAPFKNVEHDDDVDMAHMHIPGQEATGVVKEMRSSAPADSGESWDLALRLSSKVRDTKLGWVFGRERTKCDVLLQSPTDRRTVRISGMHFRIFVTDGGVVMLEDMSTNGTYVDEALLRRGNKGQNKRSLDNGSMISVVVRTDRTTLHVTRVKFMVRFPSRPGPVAEMFANNLQNYINAKAGPSATTSYRLLGMGGFRSDHGMRWDGGDKYGVIGVVGKGAFATVYKLVEKNSGTVYAAKEVEKVKFMKNGELDTKFGNELRIIKSLNHPHIVKYCDYRQERDHLYIMMEYVAHGDMSDFMNLRHHIPEDLTRSVARQLCQALKYMHDEGVTHRDIKPDNILIAKESPMVVKLTDFGLSKLTEGPESAAMKTFCGTLLYCAPEVYPGYSRMRASNPAKRLHGSQYDEEGHRISRAPSTYSRKVDIWSVAAVLFHMLTGDPPYMGTAENQGEVMLKNILTIDLDISPLEGRELSQDCIDFINALMLVDPSFRPNAAATLLHPWLAKEPDIEQIPLCRSEIESKLLNTVKENDFPDDIESDYEDTGFSSRVVELNSQTLAGRPLDINKELSDEDSIREAQQFKKPRPPLFGEVRDNGLPDSGIFGNGQNPVIAQAAPAEAPMMQIDVPASQPFQQNGLAVQGHTSQGFATPGLTVQGHSDISDEAAIRTRPISEMIESGPPSWESGPLPVLLNGSSKKQSKDSLQQDMQSNDGLQSTTSQLNNLDVEDGQEPLVYEELISPSLLASRFKRARQSNDEGLTTSKRVTLLDRSHGCAAEDEWKPSIYGSLRPTTGSIDMTPIDIKDRLIMWGRAPRNTHVYPKPLDTRVPKMGLDIVFWRPHIDEDIDKGMDWLEMEDINALVFTRATHGIKVNGVNLKAGTSELLCGKLRSGDCIEIFNDAKTGEYLRFDCEFFHGNSAAFREDKEPFTVESNQELYEIATKSKSGDPL